jgi:hypothetical protein
VIEVERLGGAGDVLPNALVIRRDLPKATERKT